MKNLKKYAGLLMMLTLLVGFTSCEDDETIFDRIVGRTWVGDLGFVTDDRYEYPLESGLYLGGDGFGEDELLYYDNGDFYDRLKIQWSVGNGSLYISYGNVAAPRELRDVYINRGRMTGSLFIDGYYYADVELFMQ